MNKRGTPAISVIVAAYKRPKVLKIALSSILNQTFEDIEIIVVADCDGQISKDVVEKFDDRRIKFVSLDENFGEQSGPNNVGVALARAPLIAFLNQDDIWFNDHLQRSLECMTQSNCDLVLGQFARISNPNLVEKPMLDQCEIQIASLGHKGSYDPLNKEVRPASTWLLKKEMHESLGGWTPARDCVLFSSYDFLIDAWRQNFKMKVNDQLSSILLPSILGTGSYHNEDAHIHKMLFDLMNENSVLLKREFRRLTISPTETKKVASFLRPIKQSIVRRGIHPHSIRLSTKKRPIPGSSINILRELRGLPPLK